MNPAMTRLAQQQSVIRHYSSADGCDVNLHLALIEQPVAGLAMPLMFGLGEMEELRSAENELERLIA